MKRARLIFFLKNPCRWSAIEGFINSSYVFLKTSYAFLNCWFLWSIIPKNVLWNIRYFTLPPPKLYHKFDICSCFSVSKFVLLWQGFFSNWCLILVSGSNYIISRNVIASEYEFILVQLFLKSMYSFFIIRIFHERFEDLSYLPAWKEMPEGLQKKPGVLTES